MVTQITAEELRRRLDDDEAEPLIDTRTADSFDQWHVREAENVPFDPSEGFDDDHEATVESIANGDTVSVICGKGLTSTPFGIELDDRGYDDVSVVQGGMEAMSELHDVVTWSDDTATIYQFQRRATGCLSYVIASRDTGVAIVVDATRQVEEFSSLVGRERLSVAAVFDTHLHADHLSGGPALANRMDVPYRLGAKPTDDHEYAALTDGVEIDLDGVTVTVYHAPGHTREMAAVVVNESFVLSSDTLLLDSVGRTELSFGEDQAERGAEALHETIHEVLLEVNPSAIVLPGHVSISDDLQFESGSPGEQIGKPLSEVADAVDLVGTDRDTFVREVTEELPEQPSDYERIIAVNAGEEEVDLEADAAELDTGANNCSA